MLEIAFPPPFFVVVGTAKLFNTLMLQEIWFHPYLPLEDKQFHNNVHKTHQLHTSPRGSSWKVNKYRQLLVLSSQLLVLSSRELRTNQFLVLDSFLVLDCTTFGCNPKAKNTRKCYKVIDALCWVGCSRIIVGFRFSCFSSFKQKVIVWVGGILSYEMIGGFVRFCFSFPGAHPLWCNITSEGCFWIEI